MDNSIVTTPKSFCFVLMPFAGEFDDIYKIGIKEACDKAGAYCERVDEQIFSERIIDRVYNQIAKADLIVADMTGRNPNVFYEVGYAHALGKLTILLTQNADDIPFDLKHFPHIVYGAKVSVLRDELEKRVKYFIENPPTKLSDTKLGLEVYWDGINLASNKAVYIVQKGFEPQPIITIQNSSETTYTANDFKIGIIAGEKLKYLRYPKDITSSKLPDGSYLHTLPDLHTLFPNEYASHQLVFGANSRNGYFNYKDEETILVRLFTKQGHKDFPLIIRGEGLID